MFLDNLSSSLQSICEKQSISQEKLAELCDLSSRFVGKIICKHSVPTLTSLEKMCDALNMTPNDLLLTLAEQELAYRAPKKVDAVRCFRKQDEIKAYPICPQCHITMEREYQAFCDRCGQKLDWSEFNNAVLFITDE